MKYTVKKQHWGDQQYFEGDTREVKNKGDAEQLIKMGLIADVDDADAEAEKAKAEADQAKKEKAEAAAKAKAEKEAAKHENKMAKEPANKAE